MATYVFRTSGKWFSSAGSAEVELDGRPVAKVTSESGGMFRGPSWAFDGLDLSWQMRAVGMGTKYELTDAAGHPVGEVSGRWLTDDLTLTTADGQGARLPGSGVFSSGRVRELQLGHGLQGSIVRETRGWANLVGTREVWSLVLPDDVMGQLRAVCLALPMVLDHQRREANAAGDTSD